MSTIALPVLCTGELIKKESKIIAEKFCKKTNLPFNGILEKFYKNVLVKQVTMMN